MKFNKLNTTLKLRLITVFFQGIVMSSTLPFIALYLSSIIGEKYTGIFLSSVVIINVIFAFLGGALGDKSNKKRNIIILQLLLSLFLFLMFLAMLDKEKYVLLFSFAYLIFNITYGIQRPIIEASIMDAIEDNEEYVYKLNFWFFNISIALGSLLGAFFYNYKSYLLFLLSSIIFFSISLLFIIYFQEINHKLEEKKLNVNNYFSAIKDTRYIFLIFGYSLILFGEFSMNSYISIKLKNTFTKFEIFGYLINGVSIFGFLMFINTFIVVCFTMIINKVIRFKNNHYGILIGLSLYSIGYILLTHFNTFLLLVFSMILATIGEIIYAPIFNSEKYKIIPDDKRGTYSAISTIGFYLSEMLARIFIVISVYFSYNQVTLIFSALLIIGSVLIYIELFKKNNTI